MWDTGSGVWGLVRPNQNPCAMYSISCYLWVTKLPLTLKAVGSLEIRSRTDIQSVPSLVSAAVIKHPAENA